MIETLRRGGISSSAGKKPVYNVGENQQPENSRDGDQKLPAFI
jgi:hypothetical protein